MPKNPTDQAPDIADPEAHLHPHHNQRLGGTALADRTSAPTPLHEVEPEIKILGVDDILSQYSDGSFPKYADANPHQKLAIDRLVASYVDRELSRTHDPQTLLSPEIGLIYLTAGPDHHVTSFCNESTRFHDHDAIAQELLKSQRTATLRDSLNGMAELNEDTIVQILTIDNLELNGPISRSEQIFSEDFDFNYVFQKLIVDGQPILNHMRIFKGKEIDGNSANLLLKYLDKSPGRQTTDIIRHFSAFSGRAQNMVLSRLLSEVQWLPENDPLRTSLVEQLKSNAQDIQLSLPVAKFFFDTAPDFAKAVIGMGDRSMDGETQQAIAERCLASGERLSAELAFNLFRFSDLDQQSFAAEFSESNMTAACLVKTLALCPKLNPDDYLDDIYNAGPEAARSLVETMFITAPIPSPLTKKQAFLDKYLIDYGPDLITDTIKSLLVHNEGISVSREAALSLLRKGDRRSSVDIVLNGLDKVRDLDIADVILTVIEKTPDLLYLRDDDYWAIANDPALRTKLVGMHVHLEKIIASPQFFQEGNWFLQLQSLSLLAEGDSAPQYLKQHAEIFGFFGSLASVHTIYELLYNSLDIPEEAMYLGVNKAGEAGLAELKLSLNDLKAKITSGNIDADVEKLLSKSVIARAIFMQYTDYATEGTYGNRSDSRLAELADIHNPDNSHGIEPLAPYFTPSPVYEIQKLSAKKENTWSIDVLERYKTLTDEMKEVALVQDSSLGFATLMSGLRANILQTIEELDEQLKGTHDSDPSSRLRLESLSQKRDTLGAIINNKSDKLIFNDPTEFKQAFEALEPHKHLHADIRKVLFAWAIRKNPELQNSIIDLPEEPDIDSLAQVREFIDHIVNQETYGDYFPDKNSIQKFKRISSTIAFEKAITTYNARTTTKTKTKIQFVPSRGLMLDISGQLANACWADKTLSIAEDNPNITALTIYSEPGTDKAKIVGSCLVIKTTELTTGRPVLILRGINPRESYINHVDVGEFYESITDYIKTVAKASKAIPAIVIDNHSGGSATNRPKLFGHLRTVLPQIARKQVKFSDPKTIFNGYDISRDTYRLN